MTVPPDADVWETLDRFLAGEVPLEAFERWVYASPRLEPVVGPERHLAFISLDYCARDARHEAYKLAEAAYDALRPGCLARDRARRVAAGLLSGTVDVVAGCRALARLYYAGEGWVPIAFVGIESELDDIPGEAEYARWEPRALAAKLADARAAIDFYRPQALAAARQLLAAL